jgi:hypothetical protein
LTFGMMAAVAASSSSTDDITPGVLGFLVFAAMAVALVFLLRSMNKQFHKITPPAGAEEAPAGDADTPDARTPAETPK